MNKDIIWFDLETTGLDISNDRIIEIGIIKTDCNLNEIDKYHTYINPEGVKSRDQAVQKHGITDEFLLNYPTFKEESDKILSFIKDCDIGGYNIINFDLPFLIEEFYRCGIDFNWSSLNILDSYSIWVKSEKRTLEDAFKKFCGKELKNAHSALPDVEATIEIFKNQLNFFHIERDHKFISNKFGFVTDSGEKILDTGKCFIFKKNGEKLKIIFNFGKWKGFSCDDVYEKDPNYFKWMIQKGSFQKDTINLVKKIYSSLLNNNFNY